MELAHEPASCGGRAKEGWTDEEIKVGDSLLHEFKQAGMALDEGVQAQYRQLSMEQTRLCTQLMAFEVLSFAWQAEHVALRASACMYCSLQVPIKGSFVMQTNKGHAGTTVLGIPQHLAQRFKFPRTSPFTRAQFSVPAGKKPVNISADVPMQRWLLGQLHSTSGRDVAYRALHALPVRWCAA